MRAELWTIIIVLPPDMVWLTIAGYGTPDCWIWTVWEREGYWRSDILNPINNDYWVLVFLLGTLPQLVLGFKRRSARSGCGLSAGIS